jgi:hypothetical protein
VEVHRASLQWKREIFIAVDAALTKSYQSISVGTATVRFNYNYGVLFRALHGDHYVDLPYTHFLKFLRSLSK